MEENKFSILYVDDEISNLRIFKNTFRKEYTIFTESSAKEGIKILKNEKIDIIISDQRMPEMSGVEFFEYTLKNYPHLNRILITGYTDFDAIKNAINDAKIYQYVQKPWRENDLSKTIKEALKIYELENVNKKLLTDLKTSNSKFAETNFELIETTKKLTIQKEIAEESNRLKSVFLSNLSHEIRTPMNGIIGFASFLEKENLSYEKRLKFIKIIVRSSEQLLKIIDDIVEISKFETKQIKVKRSSLNTNCFFEDIFEIFKTKIGDKKISLKLKNEIPKDQTTILTDEVKLQKITGNLVENAIRYTDEGTIEILCKIKNNKLIVSIKDTGIGIAPEMHEKIFERFRQEDENASKAYDGLGLGLAIVKENIRILDGTIKLESEKGKGSIFTYEIPIEKA